VKAFVLALRRSEDDHGPLLNLFSILTILTVATEMNREPQWMTLPPTPVLPSASGSGYAPVNGIKIWYAMFGRCEPVILFHGGLANSNYRGNQVPVLAKDYQVIVMDSRGHGRSSRNEKPFGYELIQCALLARDFPMRFRNSLLKY
jgi:predicted alpha/beta-fold hydrolase